MIGGQEERTIFHPFASGLSALALLWSTAAMAGGLPPQVLSEIEAIRQDVPWDIVVIQIGDRGGRVLVGSLDQGTLEVVDSVASFGERAAVLAAGDPPLCAVAVGVRGDGQWVVRAAPDCPLSWPSPMAASPLALPTPAPIPEPESDAPVSAPEPVPAPVPDAALPSCTEIADDLAAGVPAALLLGRIEGRPDADTQRACLRAWDSAVLAPKQTREYRKEHLGWSGVGRVHRGGGGIRTARFAKLIGDESTFKAVRQGRVILLPGAMLTGAGAVVFTGGVVMMGLGLVVALFEVLVCVFTLGFACDFSSSAPFFESGTMLLGLGLVGTGIGVVGLGVAAAVRAPRIQLLEWYTPEDIRRGVDAYNTQLRDELGLVPDPETASLSPRGGLDLRLNGGSLALNGRF